MSNWQAILGAIAGCIYLLGFIPYLIAINQGKVKPNRATWWIWTIVGFILVFSYRSSGADNSIWVPVSAAVCQLIIAIASLKYGEGGWNSFDLTCLIGAVVSLWLWWWFKSPLIALTINITIDFLGALPTIKKSYYKPQTEAPFPWTLFWSASLLNLFVVENFSFELFAYPFSFFSVTTVILFLLLLPRLQQKKFVSTGKK